MCSMLCIISFVYPQEQVRGYTGEEKSRLPQGVSAGFFMGLFSSPSINSEFATCFRRSLGGLIPHKSGVICSVSYDILVSLPSISLHIEIDNRSLHQNLLLKSLLC